MNKQKLISYLLLLVFLAPMAVVIEHHHDEHAHHDSLAFEVPTQDASYEVAHEDCAICEYEFSYALSYQKQMLSQTSNPAFEFLNNYNSILISGTENSSPSLRAPPTFIV